MVKQGTGDDDGGSTKTDSRQLYFLKMTVSFLSPTIGNYFDRHFLHILSSYFI